MSYTTVISTMSSTPLPNSGGGSGDEPEEMEKWKTIVIIQVIYLSFVGVVGTIANLTVIFRTLRYKNQSKSFGSHLRAAMDTTNMFILSLTVSNLGTSTLSVGIYVIPMYVPNAPVNDFTCRYVWPVRELFTAVACYSFTFIAVGRYLILFRAFRETKLFSSPVVNNVTLWTCCYLVFALPFAAAYKPLNLNGTMFCDASWNSPAAQRTYATFVVVFNAFVPAFLVSVSYIGIIRRLRCSRNAVAPISTMEILPSPNNNVNQSSLSLAVHSQRASKISVLLLLSFLITFMPYGILVLCLEYNTLNADTFAPLEAIYAIAFCLLHSGAVFDPLIIMLSSSAYRPKCGLTIKRKTRQSV